jgi:hypothetical protein
LNTRDNCSGYVFSEMSGKITTSAICQPARVTPAEPYAMPSNLSPISLRDIFEPREDEQLRWELKTGGFARGRREVASEPHLVLDRFSDSAGASCCFARVGSDVCGLARFILEGCYGMASCPSGGWLLRPADAILATYWIPREPMLRTRDRQGRILSEEPASLMAFTPSEAETTIDFTMDGASFLDCVIWRLPPEASKLVEELLEPYVLERQPIFMMSSHTSFSSPSDVYAYLIHGHAYENRFDPVHRRKICSELEAYSAYVALHGLEAATGKTLYGLLKRQIVFSVISRQTQDGGWQHGEWADFMESHYRFHNAAMQLLEAELEEAPSNVTANALHRAAAVLSSCTDNTDIGLWFLHDSLEHSVEMLEASGIRWGPSSELGKYLGTKMILNTHLDAIVTLDRYREVTGDDQYATLVQSALGAARALLAFRTAEPLYRTLYWAVGLTLLPEAQARELPLPLRAIKRWTRNYLLPELYRIKRRFPRVVMPGGLIERHLSQLHFGVNYHSVNLMDLARVWRRFPEEDFREIANGAVAAVTGTRMLQYWGEARQRQALGYWVDALYQLCTLAPEASYRRHLAEAMLAALDAGLGLPPSLLGANPEIVKSAERSACPSPRDVRLRIANLNRADRRELLVVNPTAAPIALAWEKDWDVGLAWTPADNRPGSAGNAPLSVPARGWLHGSLA